MTITGAPMCAANNPSQGYTTKLKNPVIRVTSNNTPRASEYELTKSRTTIGRDSKWDISINEDIVSNPHFQVEERHGLYYLIHPLQARGTMNGFSYHGKQYQGTDSFNHLLTHGDVFRIGEPSGTMVSIGFDDGSGDVQNIPPQVIDLRSDTLTLGSAPNNDVHLDHPTV